ncbi:hypothetical protein B0H14DRAFT_2585281 [Mycena olivaceomarginata]|nr:hypothetical protein B0H14DRAFT_2585281 [Mycena olivaceomarginata]
MCGLCKGSTNTVIILRGRDSTLEVWRIVDGNIKLLPVNIPSACDPLQESHSLEMDQRPQRRPLEDYTYPFSDDGRTNDATISRSFCAATSVTSSFNQFDPAGTVISPCKSYDELAGKVRWRGHGGASDTPLDQVDELCRRKQLEASNTDALKPTEVLHSASFSFRVSHLDIGMNRDQFPRPTPIPKTLFSGATNRDFTVQHEPVKFSQSATKATLLADQQATVAARAVDLAETWQEAVLLIGLQRGMRWHAGSSQDHPGGEQMNEEYPTPLSTTATTRP